MAPAMRGGEEVAAYAQCLVRMMLDRAAGSFENPSKFRLPSDRRSLEHRMAGRLSKLPADARRALSKAAAGRLAAPAAAVYGGAHALRADDGASLLQQAARHVPATVAADAQRFRARPRQAAPLGEFGPVDADLVLTRVHCVKKTRELLEARDDIHMAAIGHDMYSRRDTKLAPFLAGKFWQGHGERLTKVLASFPVAAGAYGGMVLPATVFLAEKDFGQKFQRYVDQAGFVSDYELFQVLGIAMAMSTTTLLGFEEGTTELSAYLYDEAGASFGDLMPAIFVGIMGATRLGPLADFIAALGKGLCALAAFAIHDVLSGLFGDDVFQPQTVAAYLEPSVGKPGPALQKQTLSFDRRNRKSEVVARYTADVEWRIRSAATGAHGVLLPPPSEAPNLAKADANLRKIDHIVVVMLENRSFDHMLGYLQAERGRREVDGVDPSRAAERANPVAPGVDLTPSAFPVTVLAGVPIPPHEIANTALGADPGHNISRVGRQMFGEPAWQDILVAQGLKQSGFFDGPPVKMPADGQSIPLNGFVIDYQPIAQKEKDRVTQSSVPITAADLRDVMGYYPAHLVPAFDLLATEFAVCDRWFSAYPGSTWVNRTFALTGAPARRSDGTFILDNDMPFDERAFTRVLDQHRVSWTWYAQDIPSLVVVDGSYASDFGTAYKGMRQFFKDVESNTLPSVAWLDPNFIDLGLITQTLPTAIADAIKDIGEKVDDRPYGYLETANDDHPPADVAHGQSFVLQVLLALFGKPEVWRKTLLIVVYDEHGGFYDHVPPQAVERPEGDSFTYYGLRVPALVASPWIGRGLVPRKQDGPRKVIPGKQGPRRFFDHCSIIRTIFERFCKDPATGKIPDFGPRVADARHLGWLLDNAQPRMELGPFVQSDRSLRDQRLRVDAIAKALRVRQHRDGVAGQGVARPLSELQQQMATARARVAARTGNKT